MRDVANVIIDAESMRITLSRAVLLLGRLLVLAAWAGVRAPRPGAKPPAAQQPAAQPPAPPRRSAADLPHRHQHRPRRRHRHRQAGQSRHRSQARRLRDPARTASRRRPRRSAWSRSTPPRAGLHAARAFARATTKRPPPPTRTRASSCSSLTTITSCARAAWRCGSRSIDFIANQLAPNDLATVMYPLTQISRSTASSQRSQDCDPETSSSTGSKRAVAGITFDTAMLQLQEAHHDRDRGVPATRHQQLRRQRVVLADARRQRRRRVPARRTANGIWFFRELARYG